MRTLIVMPAYNEAANIVSTIQGARRAAPDVDIVVVDDGSADNTAELALSAGATVLPLPVNLGYGGRCRRGSSMPLRRGTTRWCSWMLTANMSRRALRTSWRSCARAMWTW